MELKVVDKTTIAMDTVRIRLADADGAPLPGFQAGAHIEVSIRGLNRRYSLTSSPKTVDHYEICVLRTTPSRGGSAYIHDILSVGDTLDVTDPINAFPLSRDARHSVFIAGGIGITPFYSMREALHHAGSSFELHYAARNQNKALPSPHFAERASLYVDKEGRSGLDIDVLLKTIVSRSDLYVCGPRRMIVDVREQALARGWPRAAIHAESFGAVQMPDDEPIKVVLAKSGMTIEVQPGQSILDALLENDVWAVYECRRGECASCVVQYTSGEPDYRDLCLTEEQRKSSLCTCVAWAKSASLTLDI